MSGEYTNGFIKRTNSGTYEGEICVEGINLSPITAMLFTKDGKKYLWLKRKDALVYDMAKGAYYKKKKEPTWEAYLEKQQTTHGSEYKGVFTFMRLRFAISAIWDAVDGREDMRMNLFVDRLPLDKQDIIIGLQKRNSTDNGKQQ